MSVIVLVEMLLVKKKLGGNTGGRVGKGRRERGGARHV